MIDGDNFLLVVEKEIMMNTHPTQILTEMVNNIPGIGPKFSLCSVSTLRPVLNSGESPNYCFGTLQALASLKSVALSS